MESKYPESWERQTPKGYDPHGLPTANDSLALKVFENFCCNGCHCKSESDHKK